MFEEFESANALLELGANIDHRSDIGMTVSMMAHEKGWDETVAMLRSLGAAEPI